MGSGTWRRRPWQLSRGTSRAKPSCDRGVGFRNSVEFDFGVFCADFYVLYIWKAGDEADRMVRRHRASRHCVRNSAEPEPGLGESSLAGIIADEARARRRADPKAAFVRMGATMGDR